MEWPEYNLSSLTDRFISGGTPDTKVQDYWTGNIPWITGADFTTDGITVGRRYINSSAISASATNIVPKGSILMVTRTGVGKIAIAPVDIAISQDITGIVPKTGIEPDYMRTAIVSKMGLLLAAQRGATIKGITRDDVKRLTIPLPAPTEQRRIVEILDQADQLRKLRAEADKKAERILPALFNKMFGDPAMNPIGWKPRKIRELINTVSRRDPSQCPNSLFIYIDIAGVDGKLGSIKSAKALSGSEAPSRARQIIRTNDTLVSTVRPYLKATALVTEKFDEQVASTGFCVLRLKNDFGYNWLYALTRLQWFTERLNERARGASYPAVTDADIFDLIVPFPEDEDLLRRFDREISELHQMDSCRSNFDEKMDNLFSLLLQRAFSGALTASWREAHMKELLAEMELQAKYLN